MKSEFASLLDLALAKGSTHSVLLSEIKEEIVALYRKSHPKAPPGISAVVDELTGSVRLYSGQRDITTDSFASEAESVARHILIAKLSQSLSVTTPENFISVETIEQPSPTPKKPGKPWFANFLFWGYNVYFQLFAVFFGISIVRDFISRGTSTGAKEFGMLRAFFLLVFILTPAASMAVSWYKKLYKSTGTLAKVFFLFELPLAVISLLALFVFMQVTPFVAMSLLLALVTIPTVVVSQLGTTISDTVHKCIFLISQAAIIVLGYLLVLLLFFVPVTLGALSQLVFSGLFNFYSYRPITEVFFERFVQFSLGTLFILVVTGILLLPFVMLYFLVKVYLTSHNRLSKTMPESTLFLFQGAGALLCILGAIFTSYQPSQNALFDTLEKISRATTYEERESLASNVISSQQEAQEAIQDMYSGTSRYPFRKNDTLISSGYRAVFGMPETAAMALEQTFLMIAYPFVSQADSGNYSAISAGYTQVFGVSPYEKINAVNKTVSAQTPVHLSSRQVSVSPSSTGLLANVTIEEEFENTSYQQQEVIYEFFLPSGAAITDLKLGPNLEYGGIISPKGAAQRTYEAQLNIRRDPALLEQTGPRQYRLRVFPVPAKGDMTTLSGKRQKVLFSYTTPGDPTGYPLPVYTKKTNILTTSARLSARMTNSSVQLKESDTHMAYASGQSVDPCTTKVSEDTKTDAIQATVSSIAADETAKSISCADLGKALSALSGQRISIYVDTSYANRDNKEVAALFQTLASHTQFLEQNTVTLYKYNTQVSPGTVLTKNNISDAITYFGNATSLDAIKFPADVPTIAMVYPGPKSTVTQQSLYPFSSLTRAYFVHSLVLPPYTMEFTSKLLQSGGDTTSTTDEALRLMALDLTSENVFPNIFSMVSLAHLPNISTALPLPFETPASTARVANKALLQKLLVQFPRDALGDVAVLDNINSFSEKATLVSPYSSLLALVNDAQKQQLAQFKNRYDRFLDAAVTENNQNQFRGDGLINLQPVREFGGSIPNPLAPMMGVNTIGGSGMSMPRPFDSNESSDLKIMAPTSGAPQVVNISSLSRLTSIPAFLFIAGNVILIGGGTLVFVVRKLISRRHTQKQSH